MSDDLREKVARAICTAREQNGGPPWDWLVRYKHALAALMDDADAAIAAVREHEEQGHG